MKAFSTVRPISEGRFVDPAASLERQIESLLALINDPPTNSRAVTISPKLAQWILDNRNSHNRKMRPNKIKRWAAAMREKRWAHTGDTIKFARSGELLDGQNRLRACSFCNTNFLTDVKFGVDRTAFDVIDIGAPRTNPDVFQIEEIYQPRITANATRWVKIHLENLDRGTIFENAELLEYYKSSIEADKLKLAVQRAIPIRSKISVSQLAAILYLGDFKHARATARFAQDLAEFKRGGRTLITKIATIRKQNVGRIHEVHVNALITLAWRSYRDNTRLTERMLRWDDGKPYPEL